MTRRRGAMGDREFILFIALISAMSALAIDMVLPAFAEMRDAFDLAPDATDLSLTLTLFFLGSGAGFLVMGPLADAFGRKPVLVVSMGLYGGAALAAALAPNLVVLFAARFVWGLAAAGPRALSQAIVRDRVAGDAMARIMTLVQTAFFLAPVLAPLLGRGLVELGGWRWVMLFGMASAAAVVVWSFRLPETLADEHRRSFRMGPVIDGVRLVVQHRVTLGHMLSVAFAFGAFFSFLGSSELVFDDVFDRADWFVPFFSLASIGFAGVALATNRLLRKISARTLTLWAAVALVTMSAVFFGVAVTTDGTPSFGVFVVVFALTNACHIAFFPTANSLALEPMGAVAGTAAAVLGFTTSVLGAVLGSFIDRAIDGSITPMATGYLGYSIVALGLLLWARGGRVAAV